MRPSRLLLPAALCAAALAAPQAAGAAVSVGQSGWSWGSPLPQGNTLGAVELTGGRGYASGAFGTVLRTDDGGATWSGLTTGVTADLGRLRLLGPDSFVVGGGCVLRRSDDGGASFKRLPFSAGEDGCPSPLSSFSFPTSETGYLVLGDGTVTRTDDGGQTFGGRTAVPGTPSSKGGAQPTDIAFTSPEVGVALTAGAPSHVYRTTDGARSWTDVLAAPAGLRSVTFVTPTLGYAVGDASSMYATADGGQTWAKLALATVGSPPVTLTGIRCATPLLCLISTQPGDRLLRTTDGGDTARVVSTATEPVLAATFANEARVVGVGAQGTTVLSDDGGLNYRPIGGRLPGRYSGVRAASATVAYAFGTDGALARSTDGGASWTPGSVSTSEDVRDIAFTTPDAGFALDTSGALLRTDNAGSSWRILNTGTSIPPQAVFAPSERTVLLIGPRGLRRSTNGGEEFSPVGGRLITRAALAGADRAGSALFVYGPSTLLLSTDAGRTWKALRRPSRTPLRSVDFVTARRGYANDASGRVWTTSDGARRWRELLGVGGTAPVSLAFCDARSGWAVLPGFLGREGGWVLRTDDGGASWRPQLISAQALPSGSIAQSQLSVTSARSAIALAAGSERGGQTPPPQFFATTTGGDAGRASSLSLRASARTLRRGRSVTISGRLAPAEGGETAVVFARSTGSIRWTPTSLRVASNGTFSLTRRLTRSTFFVAQWQGDDDRRSDGTTVLTVRVRR
jgi:photosystem II stability/assembly factor-like uncharacterized protein